MTDRFKASYFILALFALSALAAPCQEDSGAWKGWIDFRARATMIEKFCGQCEPHSHTGEETPKNENTPESIASALDGDELPNERAMLIAVGQWEAYQDQTRCIGKAGSCDEYWACLVPKGAEKCDIDQFKDRCDGSTLVYCSSIQAGIEKYVSYVVQHDCSQASWDSTCVPDAETMEGDGPGCSNPFCKEDSSYAGCEGDVAVLCDPGDYGTWFWVADCASEKMTCSASNGTCLSSAGYDCRGKDGHYCDGPFSHICRDGKLASSKDCREVDPGFVCLPRNGNDPDCGMPEEKAECPEHGKSWCEGSTFKLCQRGKVLSFDCSNLEGYSCKDGWCAP